MRARITLKNLLDRIRMPTVALFQHADPVHQAMTRASHYAPLPRASFKLQSPFSHVRHSIFSVPSQALRRAMHTEVSPFYFDKYLIAACLWADYLSPMASEPHLDMDPRDILPIENNIIKTLTRIKKDLKPQQPHSFKQHQTFIYTLAYAISTQPYRPYGAGTLSAIHIGNTTADEIPAIIIQALEAAKMPMTEASRFPRKQAMLILSNDQIQFNQTTICANPYVPHYDASARSSFDYSYDMVITGDAFRIISLPANQESMALLREFSVGNSIVQSGSALFAAIRLCDFKGDGALFLKLSENEIISLLLSPEKRKQHFNADLTIRYSNKHHHLTGDGYYPDIGHVYTEELETNLYHHTTGPVKVISAVQEGTVGKDILQQVVPGDYIIKRENGDCLSSLAATNKKFVARLCTPEGNIISSEIQKPGKHLMPNFRNSPRP